MNVPEFYVYTYIACHITTNNMPYVFFSLASHSHTPFIVTITIIIMRVLLLLQFLRVPLVFLASVQFFLHLNSLTPHVWLNPSSCRLLNAFS